MYKGFYWWESNNNNKDNIVALSLVDDEESRCTTFLRARSEQELLSGIKKKEAGRLPPDIASRMEELYYNYRNAVVNSGVPEADEIVLSNMSVALDRIFTDVEEPFDFSSYHKAKGNPFDYYMFVQNYIWPLNDFRSQYILISNHQTEADPAVIALFLENSLPRLAEDLTYIAGDRVVTVPVCKPFSMRRNLVCVYSKKHMNDEPELIEMKRRATTKSLKEMAVLLRDGSQNNMDCTKWCQG